MEPLAIALAPAGPTRVRLESLLEQLLAEAAFPQQGHELIQEWMARSALLLLVRAQAERRLADQSGRGDFALYTRFREEVELHYKEQWPVGQYAALLRLTPTRLNRLCLRIAGRSAFDIAQDPAYFSRLFKKRFGVSPREYRLAPRQGSTVLVGTQ